MPLSTILSIFMTYLSAVMVFSLNFSVLAGLMSNCFIMFWVAVEVNMLSFVVYLFSAKNVKSFAVSKYFVVQSLSSLTMMLSLVVFSSHLSPGGVIYLLLFSAMLKAGIPPLHWWFVVVVSEVSWDAVFLINTLQKFLPFYLILLFTNQVSAFLVLMSVVVGGAGLLVQARVKHMMVFSSIVSGGWMMGVSPSVGTAFMYLGVFSVGLCLWVSRYSFFAESFVHESGYVGSSVGIQFNSLVAFMSLAGFPPFLGFYAKVFLATHMLVSLEWGSASVLLAAAPLVLMVFMRLALLDLKLANSLPGMSVFTKKPSNWATVLALVLLLSGLSLFLKVGSNYTGIWHLSANF